MTIHTGHPQPLVWPWPEPDAWETVPPPDYYAEQTAHRWEVFGWLLSLWECWFWGRSRL